MSASYQTAVQSSVGQSIWVLLRYCSVGNIEEVAYFCLSDMHNYQGSLS